MSLPILVRKMSVSETNLVLHAWKNRLYEERHKVRWARGLERDCFWPLVDHVIGKITMPTSEVLVGCYETEPGTPLCWAVLRKIAGLSTYNVLHLGARSEILKDPPLAAALERELLLVIQKERPIAAQRRPFNPFQELRT